MAQAALQATRVAAINGSPIFSSSQAGVAYLAHQSRSVLAHTLINNNNSSCCSTYYNASLGAVIRHSSSFSSSAATAQHDSTSAEEKLPAASSKGLNTEVSEYWGIVSKERRREDGSPWPWHCFRPTDTYSADLQIDVKKHYKADVWMDKLAYGTVRALRKPVDIFFKDRHVSHALLLETVAAVPGMVGGMLLHFKSLRKFEQSGGWIKALLDEAENERMHLMTWVEVLGPTWWERAMVLAVQGVFFNGYFLLYLLSPRLSHRFVAYLEEEAVHSYTEFLEALDKQEMPNAPAPLIAIDYWRLPKDATIRDVVMVIRADEAHHRDVNHFAADVYTKKQELRAAPAPIDYH